MKETFQFVFDRALPPERLDHFLAASLPELTRSQLKKLIEERNVLVDGSAAKVGLRLKGGEVLTVVVPPPAPAEAVPQQIPISVLYEDPHLIVIDKSAGMVVHPAPGHQGGTLVNALLHHCQDLSGVGGTLRPGIVHRLDKDTSGVMVATKDDATHSGLSGQFKVHSIKRRYVGLVYGLLPEGRGTVDQPIGRHPTQRKKMSGSARQGRRAVTHWRVLKRFEADRLTLVELSLETGRTHQIRVHFSEMNFPLVGDPVYGGAGRLKNLADAKLRSLVQALDRQALHARVLGFIHPASGDYMEFESPVPEDLTRVLEYLEKKNGP